MLSPVTTPALWRRCLAEFVGAAFLVAIVVGSGIAAQRLSPGDVGLQLFENAAATAAGLVALILALGPVSGAHFNPVVSLAARAFGRLSTIDTVAYAVSQIAGACVGAMVANLMYALPAVELSTKARTGGGIWLAEAVATLGLLLVIRGSAPARAPLAVGGYIGAAYFFTSSTSFANPAVTVGRMLTDTFAGIEPASAPAFVAAQLVGLAIALGLVKGLFSDG
jgi:arsenate reductase